MSTATAPRLHQLVGVRAQEIRTVWLFFFHNFFLGVGTILVYVAANVILLENNPETSLPVAYIASAVAMVGVGYVYSYFEHHLMLRTLALRVLWAVVVLTAVIALVVAVGHSMWAAVAIMAGYRLIYMLTNLEFWGVTAVVFDIRQGKRLFGVISAGEMPAKALGAILAALIHDHTSLLFLLIISFGAFMAALAMLRLTFGSHEVHAAHRPERAARQARSRWVSSVFGGNNELVVYMCLSLGALATVGTQIEYNFFVNVKYRFQDQSTVIQYVGYVLALTYLVAAGAKLVLSRHTLDRFGIGRSLLVLPVVALVGLLGLEAMLATDAGLSPLLVYLCGLYLVFEVLRRALFDPVFLVLFQPLSPSQRLKGHTQAKAFYEPLGLGLAGLMLYGNQSLAGWMLALWILILIGAIVLLNRTYRHYVGELKEALGQRFAEGAQLAMPKEAVRLVVVQLSSEKPEEVGVAIDWLAQHQPDELAPHGADLLRHPSPLVRRRLLDAVGARPVPLDSATLYQQALNDPEASLREQAARLLGRRVDTEPQRLPPLLQHTDLAIRQGALRGCLEIQPAHELARRSLEALGQSDDPVRQRVALNVVGSLQLMAFVPLVKRSLDSPDPDTASAALRAAGALPDPGLMRRLVALMPDKTRGRAAETSLKRLGAAALPLLTELAPAELDRRQAARVAAIFGGIGTPESQAALTKLAGVPDRQVRTAALRALSGSPLNPDDAPLFRQWMTEELTLAQRLLHGTLNEPFADFVAAIDYELGVLLQRLFDLLGRLYDPETIAGVRTGVEHASRERRANALEMLDNLIPRQVYQSMQALLDDHSRAEKARMFDAAVGPYRATEPLRFFVIEEGETLFSDWTISVALRHWVPGGGAARVLLPYLSHRAQLLRDSAAQALHALAGSQPNAYEHLKAEFPTLHDSLMNHTAAARDRIPEYELVLVLQNTSLFAQTPEAILSSVTPIMKEATYAEGQTIFNKGELGNCMYVIYSGEVRILDGERVLARFGKGDFFGELALLDAEARSATAQAGTDVRLFRLDQDDFYDLMEERGEVLRGIVRALCQRIRRQNQALAATREPAPAG